MQRIMHYCLTGLLACWLMLGVAGARTWAASAPPPPATLVTITGGAVALYRPAGAGIDDGARIQALANLLVAKYSGGAILLSPGHYLINTKVALTQVELRGCEPTPSVYDANNLYVVVPGISTVTPTIANATCRLDITAGDGAPASESPFALLGNAAVTNVVCYMPAQGANPSASATPTVDAPPIFHILHESKVENVGVFVCRRFAKIEGRRPRLINCYGSATDVGVSIDNSQDCARIENVHFAPNIGGGAYANYIHANMVAFDVRRCDGALFHNCFAFWCANGFVLRSGTSPTTGQNAGPNEPWAVFVDCGCDVSSNSCVTINTTQAIGSRFVNCFFTSSNYAVIANGGTTSFTGCSLYNIDNLNGNDATKGPLYNGGGILSVTNCNVVNAQGHGTLLTATAGKTLMQGCMSTVGWDTWGRITTGSSVVYTGNTTVGVHAFLTGTGAAINLSSLPAGFQYTNNFNGF